MARIIGENGKKDRTVIYLDPVVKENLERLNKLEGRRAKKSGNILGLSVFIENILAEYVCKEKYRLEGIRMGSDPDFE